MDIKPDATFRKRYADSVDREFAKARALWELSRASGFLAPEPKRLDPARRVIEYEFISDLVAIRNTYLEYMEARKADRRLLEHFAGAGRVLGVIHTGLTLGTRSPWSANSAFYDAIAHFDAGCWDAFLESSPHTFLHGDFGFANVFFSGSPKPGSPLVVIDASPRRGSSFRCDAYGSIYIDLAGFVSCLDGLVPLSRYLRIHWSRLQSIKEAFLRGYEHETGYVIDREWLARISYALVAEYFDLRFRSRMVARSAMMLVFNGMKHNYPTIATAHYVH